MGSHCHLAKLSLNGVQQTQSLDKQKMSHTTNTNAHQTHYIKNPGVTGFMFL